MTFKIPANQERLNWAENYGNQLRIIKDDIKLFLEFEGKIYITLDFHDIYNYCFPDLEMFGRHSSLEYNEDQRISFLRDIIVRYWLLEKKSLYNTHDKIILLPPYATESVDFFRNFGHKLNKITTKNEEDKKIFLEQLSKEFEDINFDNLDEPEMDRLLERINKKAAYLAFIFTPSFEEGLVNLKRVLKQKFIMSHDGINSYIEILEKSYLKDCTKKRLIFNEIKPKKVLQNYRDARAIQYVEDINENIGKNEVFLLISSSHSFKYYKKRIDKNEQKKIVKEIDGKNYTLLRDLSTLEVALLEVCNMVGESYANFKDIPNIEFENIDYKKLLNRIESDLETIDRFIGVATDQVYYKDSGKMREIIEDQINSQFLEFVRLIDQRKKADLTIMMKKISHSKEFDKILEKYATNGTNQEQIRLALKNIKYYIDNKEFMHILSHKFIQIEAQRRDIESNMDKVFKNIIDNDAENYFLRSSLDSKFSLILENKDLDNLKKRLEQRGLVFPENPVLLQLDNYLWVLYDEDKTNLIYFIEKDGKKYIYSGLNLIFISSILNQLKKEISRGAFDPKYLFEIWAMNIVKSKLIPLDDKIKLDSIKSIRKDYSELIKTVSIMS